MDYQTIFISHASEDKAAIARPLAEALNARGFTVWYDEHVLTIGDGLRREIDRGLASCDFGVVILSHAYFAKQWPQRELDGLFVRESTNSPTRKIILPVLHDLTVEDVKKYSPTLADRLAVNATSGLGNVVDEVCRAIRAARIPPSVRDALSGITIASPHQPDLGLSPNAVICLQNFVQEWEETGHVLLRVEIDSLDGAPLSAVKTGDRVSLFASYGMGNAWIEIKDSESSDLGMLRAPNGVSDRDHSLALIHFLSAMDLWDNLLCSAVVINIGPSIESIMVRVPVFTE